MSKTPASRTPAQDRAVAYVRKNQGSHGLKVARACGPNGSVMYGYRTLYRTESSNRLFSVPSCHKGYWRWYTLDADGRAACVKDVTQGRVPWFVLDHLDLYSHIDES